MQTSNVAKQQWPLQYRGIWRLTSFYTWSLQQTLNLPSSKNDEGFEYRLIFLGVLFLAQNQNISAIRYLEKILAEPYSIIFAAPIRHFWLVSPFLRYTDIYAQFPLFNTVQNLASSSLFWTYCPLTFIVTTFFTNGTALPPDARSFSKAFTTLRPSKSREIGNIIQDAHFICYHLCSRGHSSCTHCLHHAGCNHHQLWPWRWAIS